MAKRKIGLLLFLTVMLLSLSVAAEEEEGGWFLDGGAPWKNRLGPGIQLAIGGNSCTDDFCDSTMDVKFFGFGSTLGLFYRLIPNVVVFGDFHVGYINTNYDGAVANDAGLDFEFTVGGEFHAPITGWLDAYVGLGLGYALLRFTGEYTGLREEWGKQVISYRGANIQLKLGVDVYPISSAPTFAAGLLFKWGFAIWARACTKDDIDTDFICMRPEDQEVEGFGDIGQDPFLAFFGLAARYGF